ncbi:putative transposase [Streptococcus pneumoniae GA13494]|nr:putative transposase [Streptococcus pneumoniae GA13494]
MPHSAYSETLYQAGSWSHKRRVCQFSERKEGNLFYDVISLVTNMTSGTSQDQFQLYRGRGQAENFIKEMKEGFFGDKTDSSTLIKNEVRMMMSCIAYNLYLFLKHLAEVTSNFNNQTLPPSFSSRGRKMCSNRTQAAPQIV